MAIGITVLGTEISPNLAQYYQTATITAETGSVLLVFAAEFWSPAAIIPTLYTAPSRGVFLVKTAYIGPELHPDPNSQQRITMWQIPIFGSDFTGKLVFNFGMKNPIGGTYNQPIISVIKATGVGGMPGAQVAQAYAGSTAYPIYLGSPQSSASRPFVAYASWGNDNNAGANWTNITNAYDNFWLHWRSDGGWSAPVYTPVTPSRNAPTTYVAIAFELAAVDTTAPPKPTGLVVDGSTATTVALSWDRPAVDVDGAYWDVYKNGAYLTTVDNTSVTVSSLVPGNTYTFSVKAKDAYANSSVMSDTLTYVNNVVSFAVLTDRTNTHVQALLYDPTGVTLLAVLDKARNIQWQQEISKAGSASFEVPLYDSKTSLITENCIVKFKYLGDIRFGCIIRSETTSLADDQHWLVFSDQPGIGALLANAVVFPEGGKYVNGVYLLPRKTVADRLFGFMSLPGGWYSNSDWSVPQASPWNGASPKATPPGTNVHAPFPSDFGYIDPSVSWISATGPDTDTAANSIQYFRGKFSMSEETKVQIYASGDNTLDLYIDGDKLISTDADWPEAQTAEAVLGPGDHVLAAKVNNAGTTPSPVAFIASVALPIPGTEGAVAATIFHTDNARWSVNNGSTPPGWYRASVLKQLILEARRRGVFGLSSIHIAFTDLMDSSDSAWTTRGDYSFGIATKTLLDVAEQLSEAEFDWMIDAKAMRLVAMKRIGTDRTATVRLFPGNSMTSLTSTKTYSRATSVLGRMSDGTWLETRRPEDISANRYETGLELGSAETADTATKLALSLLKEHASPITVVESVGTALAGPLAYADYYIGDTIAHPAHRGTGTIPVRVMSISVDASEEIVKTHSDLMIDRSSVFGFVQSESVEGSELPSKIVGSYWPKYQHDVALTGIDPNYSLVYLFQAGPVGGQPGTDGSVVLIGNGGDTWSQSEWVTGVASLRSRGVAVLLTVGGAGAYISLSNRTRTTNFVNSIKAIYDQVGGFDGLDFNIETTASGDAIYPTEMVWAAQQLRLAYGSNFAITVPVTGSQYAPYLSHDIDIVQALYSGTDQNGVSLLTFIAPQFYDLWEGAPTTSQGARASLVFQNATYWAAYVGNDWSKIGLGFRTVGAAGDVMTVSATRVAYLITAEAQPQLRGAFHFDAKDDLNQDWTWVQQVAPIINDVEFSSDPQVPLSITDNFSSYQSSYWSLIGGGTVTSGHLQMPVVDWGVPAGARSVNTYNLNNGYVQWIIDGYPTGLASGGLLDIGLENPTDPTNKYAVFRIYRDNIGNHLEVHYRNGSSDSVHDYYSSITLGAVPVAVRFRVASDWLFISLSTNGTAWTTVYFEDSIALLDLTSVKILTQSNGTGTGNWKLDSINVAW